MKLALSENIKQIDLYAVNTLGISEYELIDRAGEAIAEAVRNTVPAGTEVLFFCGKGNNGADGYSAACKLKNEYRVTVYDVFGEGQRSDGGRAFLDAYISDGSQIRSFVLNDALISEMNLAQAIVDAIFGTGFCGELTDELRAFSLEMGKARCPYKIAVDVPLGVNANDGSVRSYAPTVSMTVQLSFMKPGVLSYPAKTYVGRIVHDTLGLPIDEISEKFALSYNYIDEALAIELLPEREENSSKGSFGRTLIITGSDRYRGAALLSLESALRGGAGYVTYYGTERLCELMCTKFPEAIYKPGCGEIKDGINDGELGEILSLSSRSDSTLIGSGSESSEELYRLVLELLSSDGGVLVLDADAINALAHYSKAPKEAIKGSKRKVVLTPHPLEFARLTSRDVSTVQQTRLSSAVEFAAEWGCILVLKGAGTIVTDGKNVYINSTGSSALAKAGSGDVLAGLIASLAASAKDPLKTSALAVYLHGRAADKARDELSSYGVTPSDLPIRIANEMAELEKKRSKCK